MKRVQNFHRKRPHMLPPLPDLPPSALASPGPLQPPDLLLMESRLGSPAPKRNGPVESGDTYNGSDGTPLIKIFEPYSKESEKFDLLPDAVPNEGNYFRNKFQKRNSLNLNELESKLYERENVKNLTRRHFGCLHDDLNKKLKSHPVLRLEESETTKTTEHNILSIASRYKPLKPIGKDEDEN